MTTRSRNCMHAALAGVLLAALASCAPEPPRPGWAFRPEPYPSVRATRRRMATAVTVIVGTRDEREGPRAGEAAFAAVDRTVAAMSRFSPASELSKVSSETPWSCKPTITAGGRSASGVSRGGTEFIAR